VRGFVKGLDNLDKLVSALHRLPRSIRPRATASKGSAGASHTSASVPRSARPASNSRRRKHHSRACRPHPLEFDSPRCSLDSGSFTRKPPALDTGSVDGGEGGSSAPARSGESTIDSGSRLFDNIAKMGQEVRRHSN